jgi:hypothetical protein
MSGKSHTAELRKQGVGITELNWAGGQESVFRESRESFSRARSEARIQGFVKVLLQKRQINLNKACGIGISREYDQ